MSFPHKSAALVIRADLLNALDRECDYWASRLGKAMQEVEVAEREYQIAIDRRSRIKEWIKENAA